MRSSFLPVISICLLLLASCSHSNSPEMRWVGKGSEFVQYDSTKGPPRPTKQQLQEAFKFAVSVVRPQLSDRQGEYVDVSEARQTFSIVKPGLALPRIEIKGLFRSDGELDRSWEVTLIVVPEGFRWLSVMISKPGMTVQNADGRALPID